MRTSRAMRAVVALGAVVAGFSFLPGVPSAGAATGLPAGFTDALVAAVSQPTSLTPLADGRVLVTSKTGEVRTITGTTASDPLTTVPLGGCTQSERGLLGAAQDPANQANVYFYFTTLVGSTCVNRVQQYTLSGSTLTPGVVLVDNIPSVGGNHNGGDLQIGKDGFLYIGVGDSGCNPRDTGNCQDANTAARDLSLPNGKILRVTLAGAPAPGNPYLATANAVSCKNGPGAPGQVCQEIIASGVRNPFRLGFDPNAASTRFFINDVGGGAWEEIDQGTVGADYGWNLREGVCVLGSTTNCPPPPASLTNPIVAYPHSTGCTSIVGGAFVPDGAWPGFDGAYLYGDFICGKIFTASVVCGSWTTSVLASDAAQVVELQFVGKDLWYTTYAGQVRRIIPPTAPTGGSPSRMVPVASARKLDTRTGIGGPAGIVPAGGTRTVSLSPEVPAGATAAVVNVTVVGATAPGYVTAWPADQPQPPTSTLNATQAGQTVANTALVAVSPTGQLRLFTEKGGHLLVDVYGYFQPGASATAGRFQSLPPKRVLDTRIGIGAPVGKVNGRLDVQVTGQGGVPSGGVSAVALVVTATAGNAGGYVTAWAAGQPQPGTSTLNLSSTTDTRANLVIVPVGAAGKVSLFSAAPSHLIADVAGWFTDGTAGSSASGLFVPVTPARLHDSRQAGRPLGTLPAGATCTLGSGWVVPGNAGAVAANLTVVSPTNFGYLSAFPGGTPWPGASNLNMTKPNDVVAAQAITKLGSRESVSYLSSAAAGLIVDVTGWFTA